MEKILISFFQKVAEKDEDEINKLKNSQYFQLEPYEWRFTLPKLFLYLQENDYIHQNLEYKQFRQLLYHSPINKTLKQQNVEINITTNKSNIDETEYCLVWD